MDGIYRSTVEFKWTVLIVLLLNSNGRYLSFYC